MASSSKQGRAKPQAQVAHGKPIESEAGRQPPGGKGSKGGASARAAGTGSTRRRSSEQGGTQGHQVTDDMDADKR